MHKLFGMIKWILIAVVILLWFGFCLQNLNASASLVLIGNKTYQDVPVPILLIFPFVVTFLLFWIVGMLDQVDQFLTIRQLKKQLRELEREVYQLRKLPIREGIEAEEAVEKENE